MLTTTASGPNPRMASSGRLAGLMVLCLALILAASASRLSASEGVDDVAQLLKAGTGEDVLLAFIDQSPVAYQPTAEEVVYLQDLGASDALIQALLKHGENPATPAPGAPPAAVQAAEAVPAPAPAQELEPPVTEAAVSTPPSDGVNLSYFYEALAPYGTWRSVDDQWVWQPTVMVVDRAWQPYSARGHWVNSDWGWAWHSDYSWGWAPFHYGRWSRNTAYGWVWTPDTVWGPAWVNWRTYDTYYGWAPLPPAALYEAGVGFHYHGNHVGLDFDFGLGEHDYCFVPVEHFCDPVLTAYVLPHTKVVNIYKKTRIIENNYIYTNHRIVNQGPLPARVQQAYGRPIKQVKIVDASVRPGQPLRGDTLSKDKLTVFRPAVAPVATTTPQALLAKQELARKQAANRIPSPTPQTQQSVLQTRRGDQNAAVTTQTAKVEQTRNEVRAQQEKLAAERKGQAAAEATRQAQLKQELETRRQQAQRDSQAQQERLAAERRTQAAAENARQAQLKQELEARREQAQREQAAATHRVESVERPQPQPRIQVQPPVRSQPQEQPRIQYQAPVRSQPQEQPRIQYQAPVRSQPQEQPRIQYQAPVRSQPQEQPRIQYQAPVRSQPQAESRAQVQAPAQPRQGEKRG